MFEPEKHVADNYEARAVELGSFAAVADLIEQTAGEPDPGLVAWLRGRDKPVETARDKAPLERAVPKGK